MAWTGDLRLEILRLFAEATRRRSAFIVFTNDDGERESEYLGAATYRSKLLEMAQALAPILSCKGCGEPVTNGDRSTRYCSPACRPSSSRKPQTAAWWRDYRARRKEQGRAVPRGDRR